jgi:pectate lyase
MFGRHSLLTVVFPISLMAAACSTAGDGSPSATGGSHASGGQANGGRPGVGGQSTSAGGAVGTGGSVSNSGGSSAKGGVGTGGAVVSAGGSTAGGASGPSSTSGTASGGSTDAGGKTGGASGGSMGASSGGASGAGGASGTAGAGGSTATTGGSTGGGGGATGKGGSSTGNGGAATGGAVGSGGFTSTSDTGGAGGGGLTGTPVTVSSTCKIPAWPTPKGSAVNISGTKKVTDYDGGGALHEGNLEDCTIGDQSSTNAILEVADGGSVKNVIFGKNVGDGIHCLGSCTIDNVWFPYVCDDAITINKDGSGSNASSISNSGFKGARDKTIQHNGGDSTLNISNVYVEVAGKLYRSCGKGGGCTGGAKHTVNVSNVVAIGVSQLVGVNSTDTATLSNICTYRTASICNTYVSDGKSESEATTGANGTNEGPSPSCKYAGSDTHALVDHVTGSATTDVVCPGANSVKTGTSATACVTGFESCLKNCAPGSYGMKQIACSGGKYVDAGSGCLPAIDTTANAKLFASAATTAAATTSKVTKNSSCSTQWAWGVDSSNSANYCACVEKPGYYQEKTGQAQPDTWIVWDCQAQWW